MSEESMTNLRARIHIHDARETVAGFLLGEFEGAPPPKMEMGDYESALSPEEEASLYRAWTLMKVLAQEMGWE